jgi:hypothetical protein
MLELVVVYNWKVGNGRKKTLKVRKTDGKRKTEKTEGNNHFNLFVSWPQRDVK